MPNNRLFLIICFLFTCISCKQNYLPPEQKTNPNILVIEGVINCKPGDSTFFQLSRTQAISDSIGTRSPETGAKLTIIGSAGDTWPFHELGNGSYATALLSLNPTERYQLKVVTKNGSQYLSDTVSVHASPAIDSLSWYQDDSAGDVHIRINTHDPANNSHYYRWYFSELWEYHSDEYAELTLVNGKIEYADTSTSTWTCWRGDQSSQILLGNSTALSQDRINQAPIAVIPRGSQKLSVRYSMLATQYVLSQPAYQYWETLQKNTQNLGSLFDPQPSQLSGNYHNTTNPKEPVIGFLSASSLQNLRFFIDGSRVHNWDTAHQSCDIKQASAQDPNDFHNYLNTDTLYWPFYFLQGALILGKRTCVDCRVQGGTTTRPDFW